MKIFIISCCHKIFISEKFVCSGADQASLKHFKILMEMGHDVRLWVSQSDLHETYDNVDYYSSNSVNTKEYFKNNKKQIYSRILKSIENFQPDIIYSNADFGSFYTPLMNLNIPIIYNYHILPGTWADLNSGNLLHEFLNAGNSMICVSKVHFDSVVNYYRKHRTKWTFDEIIPDGILFPSYSNQEEIQSGTNTIKHCSRASKIKDTFLIHNMMESTDIKSEVYTSLIRIGHEEEDPYITTNMKNYGSFPRTTIVGLEHPKMIQQISKAGCVFVGNAPDTFCITALEALSHGVPIIVKGRNGTHPAKEMITEEYSEYVHIYSGKVDFIEMAKKFVLLPISERMNIANAVYEMTSKEKYKKNMQNVLDKAVHKYQNTSRKIKHTLDI